MSIQPAITLEEIYAPIQVPVERVPQTIIEILSTSNDLATDVVKYFFSGKGKLLRPALTLLGAALKGETTGANTDLRLLRLAASYEIFHGATLIHDDIIDSAYLRRNLPTVNVKWGAQTAVLVGDYLHDKALGVIHEDGTREIFSLFLKTAGLVCDGEIHELGKHGCLSLSETEYIDIINKKTAVLLACCVEAGARFAGASEEEAAALYRFGTAFGIAFQIIDDCLDFTGDEHEFGKTLGADLAAGVMTLPLIRLLEISDEAQKKEIVAVFKNDPQSDKLRNLLGLIRESGALEYALTKARTYTETARKELMLFGDSPARQSLEKLLDYVLERNK
ncbi:MAG: polyprenyl synthetase family protein [Candidatus Omnitrophica bacterium]|nr:polyprenyl synthetase family protein [Candidatus Omnitrophota bacterium]